MKLAEPEPMLKPNIHERRFGIELFFSLGCLAFAESAAVATWGCLALAESAAVASTTVAATRGMPVSTGAAGVGRVNRHIASASIPIERQNRMQDSFEVFRSG